MTYSEMIEHNSRSTNVIKVKQITYIQLTRRDVMQPDTTVTFTQLNSMPIIQGKQLTQSTNSSVVSFVLHVTLSHWLLLVVAHNSVTGHRNVWKGSVGGNKKHSLMILTCTELKGHCCLF